MKRWQGGLAVLLVAWSAGPAPAGALRDIDFGRNTWLARTLDRTGAPNVALRRLDGDISTTIDHGTAYTVWTVHTAEGAHDALAIRIDPEERSPGVSQKSKFEINVSRQDDTALDARSGSRFVLKNGGANDLAFTFAMDDSYDPPKRWVLHAQVWQCCSIHTMPALALQVMPKAVGPAGSVGFALIARNDDDRAMGGDSASGQHLRFDDGSDIVFLQRGRPYRVSLHLRPDPGRRVDGRMASDSGLITMAIDGAEVLHHTGAWGYTPDPADGVQPTYAVKLGIYRAAQPTRQQVYFSDIRWSAGALQPR